MRYFKVGKWLLCVLLTHTQQGLRTLHLDLVQLQGRQMASLRSPLAYPTGTEKSPGQSMTGGEEMLTIRRRYFKLGRLSLCVALTQFRRDSEFAIWMWNFKVGSLLCVALLYATQR